MSPSEPIKASISIWLTATFLCLPFWLKTKVKLLSVGYYGENLFDKNICRIEWDSHLTEESCKQLWSNYNGTEEYETCDLKQRLMSDNCEYECDDCEYQDKLECVSFCFVGDVRVDDGHVGDAHADDGLEPYLFEILLMITDFYSDCPIKR